jgi:hypothetical protein
VAESGPDKIEDFFNIKGQTNQEKIGVGLFAFNIWSDGSGEKTLL